MEANIKMYKDKPCKEVQVFMLPIDKKGTIMKIKEGLALFASKFGLAQGYELYITTDEEIKKGDWILRLSSRELFKAPSDRRYVPGSDFRKIIASTDPKLTNIKMACKNCKASGFQCSTCKGSGIRIHSDVAQPSQDFIEAYCKAGGIDKVLVEYETCLQACGGFCANKCTHGGKDQLFIKIKPDNTIIIHPLEEKTYTKYEVSEELRQLHDILEAMAAIDIHNEIGVGKSGYEDMEEIVNRYRLNGSFDIDKWIEENLK